MATRPYRKYVITENSKQQWTDTNPILTDKEIGIEDDTGFFKIGDNVKAWNDLPYVMSSTNKAILVFPSEDADNLVTYGSDGGIKLEGEYFNAVVDYNKGKGNDPLTVSPTKQYNLTIFTIGRDIKNILLDISNIQHELSTNSRVIGIDDSLTSSANTTWSVNKIKDHSVERDLLIKADLLNNHASAYQALQDLSAALQADPNMATAVATELGNMVRFNTSQSLTNLQKNTARDNIDAVAKDDLGTEVNLVTVYTARLGNTTGSSLINPEV